MIPKNGKAPWVQFYGQDETKKWEEQVGWHALHQLRSIKLDADEDFTLPIQGCRIIAQLRFNFDKPKSYPKSVVHHVRRPDLDNLSKALLDGLVVARVLEDDGFVTDLTQLKRYADAEHPAGVEVELTCLPL